MDMVIGYNTDKCEATIIILAYKINQWANNNFKTNKARKFKVVRGGLQITNLSEEEALAISLKYS